MLRNFPENFEPLFCGSEKVPPKFPPNFPAKNQKNSPTSFCRSSGKIEFVRVSFWLKDLSRIFFLSRLIFPRILSLDSLFLEKVHRKILQKNPWQNPPNLIDTTEIPATFLQRGRAKRICLQNLPFLEGGCGQSKICSFLGKVHDNKFREYLFVCH